MDCTNERTILMNNVNLTGRLTRDIDLRKTQSNLSVCNFTIALNNGKDEQGNERPATFINCKAWRNSADFLDRYARKGSRIGIVGSLETEKFKDRDGNERTSTYVLAQRVEIYDTPRNEQTSLTGTDKDVTGATIYKKDIKVDDQFDYNPFEDQSKYY